MVSSSGNPKRDTGRPYRSKRHPPCHQCRRKKLRCEADEGRSCRRCQARSSPCSFTLSLHPRSLPPIGPESDHQGECGDRDKASPAEIHQNHTSQNPTISESAIDFDSSLLNDPAGDFLLSPQPAFNLPERPMPQAIQTLDYLKGVSSQLIGASGESDPWLLRHCKFDEHGFLLFHQVHFRNAGGVPRDEKIPVHFLVTANELYDVTKETTRYPSIGSRRDEVNSLVSLECGRRLVSLYVIVLYMHTIRYISAVLQDLFQFMVYSQHFANSSDPVQIHEIYFSNSADHIAI